MIQPTAPQDPQQPQDPVREMLDRALDAQKAHAETSLRATFHAAVQSDPNTAARAVAISRQFGLDPETLTDADQLKVAERLASENELLSFYAQNPNLDRIMRHLPTVRMLRDDVGHLKTVSDTFDWWRRSYETGAAINEAGYLKAKGAFAELSDQEQKRLAELHDIETLSAGETGVFPQAAQLVGQLVGPTVKVTAAGAAVAGATALFAPEAAGAAFLYTTLAGWFAQSAVVEFGHEYETIHDGLRDALIAKGVAPADAEVQARDMARLTAGGYALTAATLEVAADALLAAPFAKAAGALVKPGIPQVTRAAAGSRFLREIAQGMIGETATEGLQELASSAAENVAGAATGTDFGPTVGESFGRAGDVMWQMAQGMLVIAPIGPSIHFLADSGRVERAQRAKTVFDGLAQKAAESQTRKRDAQTFGEVVGAMAKDGPEAVYIEGGKLAEALQQAGVTDQQLKGVLPDVARQLAESVATGGDADVIIPMGDFAAHIAGSELYQHVQQDVRLEKDGFSAAHAESWLAERDKLREEAQQAIERSKAEIDTWNQQLDAVEERIQSEVIASPRLTKEDASHIAMLHRRFVEIQAARLRITPAEFDARYRLAFQFGETTAPALDQRVQTDSPEFRAWFGESKVVDAEGKPLVVYHTGTFIETEDTPVTDVNGMHFGTKDAAIERMSHAGGDHWLEELKIEQDDNGRWYWRSGGDDSYDIRGEEGFDDEAEARVDAEDFVREQDFGDLPMTEAYLTLVNPKRVKDQRTPEAWREAIAKAKAEGYDGLIYRNEFEDKGKDSYVAFRPEQIKSVNNRGTFDPNSANILEQATTPDLIVQHNLTASNLQVADELGGLPAPSLAVSRIGHPMHSFGDITLLGPPSMIEGQPTFTGDAYAPRFPDIAHDRVRAPELRAWWKTIIDLAQHDPSVKETGISGHGDYEIDRAAEAGDRVNFERRLADSWAGQLAFLRSRGWTGEEPFFERRGRSTVAEDKTFVAWARSHLDVIKAADDAVATNREVSEESRRAAKEVTAQVKAALRRLAEVMDQDIVDSLEKRAIDEDTGLVSFGELARIRDDANRLGEHLGDINALRDIVKQNGGREALQAWVREQGALLFHNPRVRVKGRLVSATAENIVEAMVGSGRMRSQEKAMTHGPGAAKAQATKKLTSVREVQAARGQIAPTAAEFEAAKKTVDELRSEYQDLALENAIGDRDTWDTLNDSMRVLGELAKRKKITSAQARAALQRFGFNPGPELIDATIRAASALRDSPVEYFETKPMRVVRLSEFRAAVVPQDATEARAILEKHGVPVTTYANTASREDAVRAEAERLGLLFQQARGAFDPTSGTAFLLQPHDASTFLHEMSHYWLATLARAASDPNADPAVREDMQVLLTWFGVKDLDAWNAMSLEQQRQHHETFAYNAEQYLHSGVTPANNAPLRRMFRAFAQWLRRVYRDIRTTLNENYRAQFGRDLPALTPEVRQVYDRLLASEDAILAQEQSRALEPLFRDRPAGMSDADWQAYQRVQDDAHNAAVDKLTADSLKSMRWLRNAKGRVLREIQKETRAARSRIEAEERTAAEHAPVNIARRALLKGESLEADGSVVPVSVPKINLDDAKRLLADRGIEGGVKALLHGMTAEDGASADLLAGVFGFQTGSDLVYALATAPDLETDVQERTDRRMLAEHGDLKDEAQVADRIDKALHNQARTRMVAAELRFLANVVTPVQVMVRAARAVAREVVGKEKAGTVSARDHSLAEIRARREADRLRKLGDEGIRAQARQRLSKAENAGKTLTEAEKRQGAERLRKLDDTGLRAELRQLAARAESEGDTATAEAARNDLERLDAGGTSILAARAKRRELLEAQAVREAIEARGEIAELRSLARKLFRSDEKLGGRYDIDYVGAARALAAAFGLQPGEISAVQYIEQLRTYNPELFEQLTPVFERAKQWEQEARQQGRDVKTWKDLTVDEFRDLSDAIGALWHLARETKQVEIAGEREELDTVAEKIREQEVANGVKSPEPTLGAKTPPEKRARSWRRLWLAAIRPENWAWRKDLGEVGVFTKYVWRPIREAVVQFVTAQDLYTKRVAQMVRDLTPKLKRGLIEFRDEQGRLLYTFGRGNGGFGMSELVGALLHTGNESNFRKLLLGREWGTIDQETGDLDASAWTAFRQRMIDQGYITKDVMDFVQGIWDLNEELKPLAQAAHRKLFGYRFREVVAAPISTPWGSYRGGYMPAKVDAEARSAPRIQGLDALEKDARKWFASTGRGFTFSRVEGFAEPLSLDLNLIPAHIDDVLRFAYLQPAVRQVDRILKHDVVSKVLAASQPDVYANMLLPWLQRVASQSATKASGNTDVDAFFRAVRRSVGMSTMFANVANALQQLTGGLIAAVRVHPKYLTRALWSLIRERGQLYQDIADQSAFMAHRQHGQIFDSVEAINRLSQNQPAIKSFRDWVGRHAYFAQTAMQNIVDAITWKGAYEQAIEESGLDSTDEAAQKEAVARADAAVRLTQGSFDPTDVANYEEGTPVYRVFTQFSGYFSMLANLHVDELTRIGRMTGIGKAGRLFALYAFAFALPTLFADAITRTLRGQWDDEDKDGSVDVFTLDFLFLGQLRALAAEIPVAGPNALAPLVNLADNKDWNDRFLTSPVVSTFERAIQGSVRAVHDLTTEATTTQGQQAKEKRVGADVRDVITLVGLLFGLPTGAVGTRIGYAINRAQGTVEDTSAFATGRALVGGALK